MFYSVCNHILKYFRFEIETPFKLLNIPQFVYIQGWIHNSNLIKTIENI